jgi:hypothetical protein
MGLFKKKADPITERARALQTEIAALEAQIQKMGEKARHPSGPEKSQPVARSGSSHTPVFETGSYPKNAASPEPEVPPQHFNELGVRKYDLGAAFRRLKGHFRGPANHNPKLISYLAAGSIKGLRPLRYERRVARNRFIALFVILVLMIWGIAAVLLRRH